MGDGRGGPARRGRRAADLPELLIGTSVRFPEVERENAASACALAGEESRREMSDASYHQG